MFQIGFRFNCLILGTSTGGTFLAEACRGQILDPHNAPSSRVSTEVWSFDLGWPHPHTAEVSIWNQRFHNAFCPVPLGPEVLTISSTMAAVRKVRYVHEDGFDAFNDTNNPCLAPFTLVEPNILEIEPAQYDAWVETDGLELLAPHFTEVRRAEGKVPRLALDKSDAWPEWYDKVYRVMMGRANASRWWLEVLGPYGAVPPVIIIERQRALSERDADAITWLADELQRRIDTHNTTPGVEPAEAWFVKCGTCSTKHDNLPPAPMYSGREAVDYLLLSAKVRVQMFKGHAQCVVMRPWDKRISDVCELRVFVRDERVVGVSQQACYSPVPVLHMMDPQDVVGAAQTCFDAMNARLPPKRKFSYECTFDAFFSTTDEAEVEVHPIEINSEMFGWGPAGASLFNWLNDPPPPPDAPPVLYVAGCR